MKKIISIASALFALLLLVFVFPALAKDERPKGLDDRGPLTKITFIHYKKDHAKPPNPPGRDKDKPEKGPACYGFLAKGVVWKDFHQDLYVQEGIDIDVIDAAAETWDAVTSTDLYGESFVYPAANWDDDQPDFKNELSFGNYSRDGVIAVTNVWGYFNGPPPTREIIEFDILFDTDYPWGDGEEDPNVMDLQNIASHELGHGWGMGDVYDTSCSAVTMYGYSDYGETDKRTLELPDVTGLQSLYGI